MQISSMTLGLVKDSTNTVEDVLVCVSKQCVIVMGGMFLSREAQKTAVRKAGVGSEVRGQDAES